MKVNDSSYAKTTALALAATAICGFAAFFLLWLSGSGLAKVIGALAVAGALASAALVAAGCLVLVRERRSAAGAPDLYLESNAGRSAAGLESAGGFRAGPFRRLVARAVLGHDFMVGDEVEILGLDEIEATLDESGCLDGLPFQAEMARYCGYRARVFRSIDKIYDYGRTRTMRRLDRCVLLAGLRCDGSDHGACQALCYIVWNVAWLRRPGAALPDPRPVASGRLARPQGIERLPDGTSRPRFHCQYTQLHAASSAMGALEVGKELRPLVAGNLTLATWLIGLGTRYFNLFQSLRGGTAYPTMAQRTANPPAIRSEALYPGDRVVVRSNAEIASTLNDKNKHRGLWFDRDQLKYCGTEQIVLARVDRIIDDVHGQMLPMKTPCILLDGVDYSGESFSFSAQHDLFFWREAWLEKRAPAAPSDVPPQRDVT